MFKLMKYARKIDWVLLFVIMGLTVLQVYCTMTQMDYIGGITKAITFLDYHNNPGKLLIELNLPNPGITTWEEFLALIGPYLPTLPQESQNALNAISNATVGDIWYNAGMMILCATGMITIQIIISALAAFISSNLATSIRGEINKKISSFSLAELNKFSTASLVTRTTNDVQQYQLLILLTLRMFFASPVTAIWAICKIQAVSWQLMLPTAVGVVLLIAGILMMFFIVVPKFKIQQTYLDKLNALTREHLTGIRVVHAYNAEKYQQNKFEKSNADLTRIQLFNSRAMSLFSPYISIIMNGISIAVYWIGSYIINDPSSSLDYSQLLSFMMLSTQIVMSFMMLIMMFFMVPRATVSAKRILEVLESKNSILDPEVEIQPQEEGHIVFNHVSFKYPDADENTIEDISFEAKKGQTIAFIGATGSGKSTILNLVARLYDATEGEVLVDGVNVKDLKQKNLRSKIGFVPQKGLLFRGTIHSNISLGREELPLDEVQKACEIAEADSFIQEMEGGYEAKIAQGGTNVSGGQRQRLCIARAVSLKPEFLVFDDSFSALDFKTDRKVRDNLKREMKDATKLIVAQRIGTIMDADCIVCLSDGKAAGVGTHQELLKNCETYREIALSQLSEEELGL